MVTHYQRLLDYIVPDFVHVLYKGQIVKSAGKELVLELEEKGYDWIKKSWGNKTMIESITSESTEQRIFQLFKENISMLNEGAGTLLRNDREKAMKAFRRMGIPDRKVENYKYTDLTKLFARENYNRAFLPTSFDFDMQEVFTCDVPEFDTHILFHVNGWYFDQNRTDQFPKGTIIKSMKKRLEGER